ncbi:hypothetical protein [Plantactinospora sp. WMMB782]|uniref:hypothetical protein n=1 Tax=Plantactinospora sp. WMMB782 TaxID=3404121 RepID=UPI003B95C80E
MRWWKWWKDRRIADVERAAWEWDAAEAEAARQRVLEMARRERDDPDREDGSGSTQQVRAWHDPTSLLGPPHSATNSSGSTPC